LLVKFTEAIEPGSFTPSNAANGFGQVVHFWSTDKTQALMFWSDANAKDTYTNSTDSNSNLNIALSSITGASGFPMTTANMYVTVQARRATNSLKIGAFLPSTMTAGKMNFRQSYVMTAIFLDQAFYDSGDSNCPLGTDQAYGQSYSMPTKDTPTSGCVMQYGPYMLQQSKSGTNVTSNATLDELSLTYVINQDKKPVDVQADFPISINGADILELNYNNRPEIKKPEIATWQAIAISNRSANPGNRTSEDSVMYYFKDHLTIVTATEMFCSRSQGANAVDAEAPLGTQWTKKDLNTHLLNTHLKQTRTPTS
jgi:hypothetical protein